MKTKNFKAKKPSPLGYLLLAIGLLGSAIIPSLTVLNPQSFVGIANSSIPYGVPKSSFKGLALEPLFKSILNNGAQIILVDKFKDRAVENTAGLWVASEGTMMLKVGEFSYQQYKKVLRHEAIHMAQSCKNNSLTAEPLPLGIAVTQQGLNSLQPYKKTNPDYYLSEVEREAYSNDTRNDIYVIKLLDKYCGSRPWIKVSGFIRGKIQSAFLPETLR